MACNGVLTTPNKNDRVKLEHPALKNFYTPPSLGDLKFLNPAVSGDEKYKNVNLVHKRLISLTYL